MLKSRNLQATHPKPLLDLQSKFKPPRTIRKKNIRGTKLKNMKNLANNNFLEEEGRGCNGAKKVDTIKGYIYHLNSILNLKARCA